MRVLLLVLIMIIIYDNSSAQTNQIDIGFAKYDLENRSINRYLVKSDSVFKMSIPSYKKESYGEMLYEEVTGVTYSQIELMTIGSIDVYDRLVIRKPFLKSVQSCTLTLNDSSYCLGEMEVLILEENKTLRYLMETTDECDEHSYLYLPPVKNDSKYYFSWGKYYNIQSGSIVFVYLGVLLTIKK